MSYTECLSITAATGGGPSAMFDAQAIKRSIATPTVDTVWSASDLDGDFLSFMFERAVTITTTAATGVYRTDRHFEIHGLDAAGNVISSAVKLTNANGPDTVETPIGFRRVTAVLCPAQHFNSGTIKVGIGSVILATPAQAIEVGTAGVVKLGTLRGRSDVTLPANLIRPLAVTYIDRSNATFPVSLYR